MSDDPSGGQGDHSQTRETMRAALIEGEESGLADDFDVDAFLAALHAEHPHSPSSPRRRG
jgi:Arc/MetJ-type ribon-helix-helix transcriptional regulator